MSVRRLQPRRSDVRRRVIPVAEPLLAGNELEYVTDAVRSGWISSIGAYVLAFERELASACGAEHAVAVSSGTAALHLALVACDVGPGDEVIAPSLTFAATASAVRYVGADPVLADSEPGHWCISLSDLEKRVGPRTRAVIPVHLYGHPADVDALLPLAQAHGLAVIEDAAEALGARLRDRPVGALGNVGVLSFYGNKLITTGEGGALITNDGALAERAFALRDHAMHPERRYWHDEIGFNYRMTNLQAALGVAQLERLDVLLARKRSIAQTYREGLANVPGLGFQTEAEWASSSWWMTTITVAPPLAIDRDELAARLRARNIDTRPSFVPLHLLPPFRQENRLPVAEAVGREGLTLPSGAALTDGELDYVIECVRRELSA